MNGINYFIHPSSLCESSQIGESTHLQAFTHILPGAKIGRDCNICDHVFIGNDVIVGDAVTVKSGVQLGEGMRIGDRVFIGPNVTFADEHFPSFGQKLVGKTQILVEDDVFIGANATILPGIIIGRGAAIGAGAVVTSDVPPNAAVVGNPAIIIGYQDNTGSGDAANEALLDGGSTLGKPIGSRLDLGVGNCWLERLPNFTDMRGSLTPLEMGKGLPFVPERVFLVHGVPSHHVRGEHAHHLCEQFLVAAHGALSVVVDDGENRREIRLEDQTVGLYLAPMVWGIQYKFDRDTVLLVVASHVYDAGDYIRDYSSFRRLRATT